MNPERWAQIEELFHHACECDSKDRNAFLNEACRADPELRREVEQLLTSEEHASDHLHAAVREQLETIAFPLAGETISHYRILDGLASGGMGLVYTAEDIKLGRRVALKFLPEDSPNDCAALGRFEREARAASALEHPSICPIYEFGEHQGQPFLVMQLLEGRTLRELISAVGPGKPAASLSKLLDLGIQITAGLEAAHIQGIVHRDIKPANLFVTSQGQAKILDFGLAKLASLTTARKDSVDHVDDDEGAQQAAEKTVPLTTPDAFQSLTGVAMGTAGYMSPEQVRGEKLDGRTDLFSFGLVLYEMATGHRAFKGDTGPSLQRAILNESPASARELNPKIPPKLEKIIDKTLIKDREARYQSAADLHADLEALRRELESKLSFGSRAMAAGAAAVLLIASTVFWFTRHQRSLFHSVSDLKLQQLTINSSENAVSGGAISPDGKYIAYADAKGMHVKLVGSEEALLFPEAAAITNEKVVWEIVTAWFPDSKRFLANAHPVSESQSAWSSHTSSVWVFSVLGGVPRKLRDNASVWSVSPDGTSISFGTNKGVRGERELWLMGPNGEQAHKLYEVDTESAICCLYFFPNGQRVSYVITDKSGGTLVGRDLRGGPVTTLLPQTEMSKMGDFSWLPDERLIYADPCNGLTMRFDTPCNYSVMRLDTHSGNMIEKPRRLTNWSGIWMTNTSTTADGKHVAFLESSGRGASYVADLEAGGTRLVNSRRFTLNEGGEDAIDDWTADSKAVIVLENRADHYALYKQSLNADTQEPLVARAEGGLIEIAILSPDQKWIILQVYPIPPVPGPIEPKQIWRAPVTGGSPEYLFTVPTGSAFSCSRFPSNLCALAEPTEDRKQFIVTVLDPNTGRRGPELLRFERYQNPNEDAGPLGFAISPNGDRLATSAGPEGPIRILSFRGRPTQIVGVKNLNNMESLDWSADEKGLFLSTGIVGNREILHVDLKGNAKPLWKCGGDRCFVTPSPDGRHLSIYDWKVSANMWIMQNF